MMRSPAASLRVRGSQCTIIRWVGESVWDGASVWRACACAYVCGWSFVLQLLFIPLEPWCSKQRGSNKRGNRGHTVLYAV